MMRIGGVLAAASLGLFAASGAAQAQAAGNVKVERQNLMKEQGRDLAAVKGYLEGKVDRAKALAAATDLTRTTNHIPNVFPQGSAGPAPGGKYAAKPEIWADWSGFIEHRDAAASARGNWPMR